MSADTLSDLLRAVRLTGAVFFAVDAQAPWVAEAPRARELGPIIMPGVEHVIEFHVVASGECWASIAGAEAGAVRLERGDVVIFPQGDAHVLSSTPGMRADPDFDSPKMALVEGLPLAVRIGGPGPERAEVICGFLGCDARPFNPLLSALPRMIHVRHRPTDDGLIEQFVRLALAESTSRRAGGECVLARLSELLFVEVVRRYLSSLPADDVSWLAALRDENIGRALAKLHDRPAHPWSLEELAREVAMSRSVLAERFNQLVGVPPMQYLARWRMQLAGTLLDGTSMTLLEVAERVGYGSEAALSRAFKRTVGMAPAEWRRRKGVRLEQRAG